MRLTTPVDIVPFLFRLGYQHPTLVIGSCFAANMGERLSRLRFPVLVNPFGVVYNPISIVNCIELLLGVKTFDETDLFYNNGLWSSFYHHSCFSSSTKKDATERIKLGLENSRVFLQKADRVIITLGTARVYEYNKTGLVVSNCHKLSAAEFTHRLLNVDECYSSLSNTIGLLRRLNPELKVVLTVSPIRHIKDGAYGNQLSKSTLLLATDALCKDDNSIAYFPSYEIMMDELRDYRYYANDMLHPSALAIEYIWERFCSVAFDDEAKRLMPELEKILAAKGHRPFNPNGEEYRSFKAAFLKRTKTLKKRYPFLNLAEEICIFDET
ncbi:MAG: GSCFA domain-containing protein [Prevotellaceae bacterium]|jgi:hypothetical protein|nr:GSCFA domain-containing protein [Prevotellaceae bacterium]